MVRPKPKAGPFDWLAGLFAPRANGAQPRGGEPGGARGEVAVKCDLCRDLGGAGPACVRSCPTGAAIRLAPADAGELRRMAEELVS
jgi:Fe-S-cluster-containing hydrogenase component 2